MLLKSNVQSSGGLEKYASRIAQGFIDRGAEVKLLTKQTRGWPSFWRLEQFDRFTRDWLKEHPADIIFGMDRNRFQTHIRAGNGVHAAYLESRVQSEGIFKWLKCHLNPLHRTILSIEKTAFENPCLERLFTNSHMVRRQILERFRIDANKIQVIHNGVEWKEMEKDFSLWPQKREEHLKSLSLSRDFFHLLFIGNGYLRKGLTQLLNALTQVPEIYLSVIGKDNQASAYQHLVHRLGLADRVRFFGPATDIRPFYQYADALAIPSFYDPFANVTVEALAMGLFVISSKTNGGHEILTPEQGCVIEDLLNTDSVATSLRLALKHRKTPKSASALRESIRHLDFSHQLDLLLSSCLD